MQSLAENDIKPQNFTSSVAPRQLLLEEKPISHFRGGGFGGYAEDGGVKFGGMRACRRI